MPELKITVKPDGTVEIDAVGFTGTKCQETSMPYERELGFILTKKKKPEMLSGEGVNSLAGSRNRINR